MRKQDFLFVMGFLGCAAAASAHGVISSPPSRNYICGKETYPAQVEFGGAKTPACSTAFKVDPMAGYNYMGVLTHSWGREQVTPLPKNVCGFDGESWNGAKTPWDAAMAWPASPAAAGPLTITWDISSGAHFGDTRDFRYWITKPDFVFSPEKELAWTDFEDASFCALDYDDTKPAANPAISAEKVKGLFHTQCTVPPRSGHHVIYAEWGRTEPTKERFHGCIDLAFGATTATPKPKPAFAAPKLSPPAEKRTDMLGRLRHRRGPIAPVPSAR